MIPKRAAQSAANHIQDLVNHRIGGLTPPAEPVKWAGDQKPRIVDYLSRLDLIPGRLEQQSSRIPTVTLSISELFDQYVGSRQNTAPSTQAVWKRAQNQLESYFGKSQRIDHISVGDAIEWMEHLRNRKKKPLAESTCRKMVSVARQVFKRAVKKGLIALNPFEDEELPVAVSAREKEYVPIELIQQLLNVLPSTEWQAVIVLARIAGLRVQSEAPLLKWTDIDWDNNFMVVYSPKTKQRRQVPLFPDVRKVLMDLQSVTGDGEFILRSLREKSSNWRQPLQKMMTRAGIKPWGALFNALRSSAEIDIARQFGIVAATQWVGNSDAVALKHYLRTTESDFQAASVGTTKLIPRMIPKTHAETRDTMKSDPIDDGGKLPEVAKNAENTAKNKGGSLSTVTLRVVPTGLEPVTFRM